MRLTAFVRLSLLATAIVTGQERQITFSSRNHVLDNNDNFSKDDRFLCFDVRNSQVRGNGAAPAIMKVDLHTGEESVVYEPAQKITDSDNAAPGVIAASYNPVADEIVFIHGPHASETAKLGFYSKTNRRGAVASGSNPVRFLDFRDTESAVTPPGAHRGGTHRHEYSADGRRVGFTYDDHLLSQYGRTIGILVPHPKAPGGTTHWFAILVPVVPEKDAKPGDLVEAAQDSWVGRDGRLRAFIGRVKEADGRFVNSLFVAAIPAKLDITSAKAGTRETFPAPPKGVTIRRLTLTEAGGIVRGSPDGNRIAYLAATPQGDRQVFLINADGSGETTQLTRFPGGLKGSFRWSPRGDVLAVSADNGVFVVNATEGPAFGQSYFVTSHGKELTPVEGVVWSNAGTRIAFNRRVPGLGKDANGLNFQQIFVADAINPAVLLKEGTSFTNLRTGGRKRTFVFCGETGKSRFNLHSYLIHFDGKFWAMWSSSRENEEDPDQQVLFATSADGHQWSKPGILASDPAGEGRWIARGFFIENGQLQALAARVDSADYKLRGRNVVWKNLSLERFAWSSGAWKPVGTFADGCMSNFPPQKLADRTALVCRDSRMDVFMALRNGDGTWSRTALHAAPPFDRMDEPTIYPAGKGSVHMLVRDNTKGGFLLRAISHDDGKTWSQPVRTNYPDATSKNFAGQLSDGRYYLINNPNQDGRDPLAISFSLDGWVFGSPLAVAQNAPKRRMGPRAGVAGTLQYPHAIEHGGALWVIFSTNKEDIELVEIPLKSISR